MQLSIIVPVYNVEKYISRALFSILDNDLESGSYEIIVVDDESPDGSVAIVREIAASHSGIKIISQLNKGLGGARNTGIQNASGKYILFLDADDWINPGQLRNLVERAQANDLDILEFGALGITPENKQVYRISLASNGVFSGFRYVKKFRYMWSTCNKIYNADFLKRNELYFEEYIYSEDFEFFTRLIPKVNRIEGIPDIAASFYQSDNSITRNKSLKKRKKLYKDLVNVIELLSTRRKASSTEEADDFYAEHLGIIVATLFYQFVKNKEAYQLALVYRRKLLKKGLFFTDHKIYPFSRDVFRRVFLKNFVLFKLLLALKR